MNNSECPSEIAETMGDDAISSKDPSGNPNGSNSDLIIPTELEPKDSVMLDSEVSQSIEKCIEGERGHQENTTERIEKGCVVSDRSTPIKVNSETGIKAELQVANENTNNVPKKNQGIFFSTPNVTRRLKDDSTSPSSVIDAPDFGLVSPLDVKFLKGKQNLKRKYSGLQPIEEIDEDTDTTTEKKLKMAGETDVVVSSVTAVEAGSSSAHPCFEAPAKSLLKKWQPSCLSRNSAANSFIVLDEWGETENEDCSKLTQEYDSSRVDDFEIACQSLTEELMKSSSNIETLEKYHSQVQLENQMDDEKFDEILKELTRNTDLDDETCLSVKSMDESTINEADKTLVLEEVTESVDALLSGVENKSKLCKADSLSESLNTTVTEGNNHCLKNESDALSINEKKTDDEESKNIPEAYQSGSNKVTSEIISNKDKPSTSEEEMLDEEEFLLGENMNTKDKPYEFFEFVSADPKENEDNYNPEWQKLGRLTSDEERYKAVRDRWRSLVPPDPNRNLTFRQWRARNKKPPIKLSSLNNNHQLLDDNEKNQLCTAVFENKIKKIVQELEDSRMNIYRERTREFVALGRAQDDEQMRASMRGFSFRQLAELHNLHVNQCRAVKNQYDQELKRIHDITEEKIRILREASEEVLLFQKFYKGVGASDDNEIYMTDIQVQELMETEDMLEQYNILYK